MSIFSLQTEYENAMGRIIAVNLAHWRKRQQKGTEQAQQDKREYQENVQEKIETVNEGKMKWPLKNLSASYSAPFILNGLTGIGRRVEWAQKQRGWPNIGKAND